MSFERVAIVGAGPAGLATARAYRRHGGDGDVALIGQEALVPYRRPPLSKEFLRGELDAAELPIERPEWFAENGVTLRARERVTAIDPVRGSLLLQGGERLQADAIVLATGSEPVRPELPGLGHAAIATMRTLDDSLALSERASEGEPMIVIGTGFIGCEIAGSLAMRGDAVTLIGEESLPQAERLGDGAARRIADWLGALGVELVLGVGVRSVHEGRVVELLDGRRLRGAWITLGMGARPRGEIASAAGLLTSDGAVVVDESMRAARVAHPVLAVGDVARAYNVSAGRHLRVEHWGDALEHGELAGKTLAGAATGWDSVPGFWSTIGSNTLKYAAWGDGYERSRLDTHPEGAFTVWYERDGAAVGVLTHDRDEDYERGREIVRSGGPVP
ncbi:MAG TPA: FAD-dependent oxidoreductase [Solirubrobacteraceae bacterium]|jgi:NADPH-dependent 2,4-dienoyl-CoA reductase/sulfur reductase-like enzyme|nr:FAD-dependent oxidoreductase [Solirubrobacteraceae bacterium]